MKITITDIADYVKDEQMMAGDASHMGYDDVLELYLEERRKKIRDGKWEGLPFTCEADSIEDAIDMYNKKYCECEYILAADADYYTDEDEEGDCTDEDDEEDYSDEDEEGY